MVTRGESLGLPGAPRARGRRKAQGFRLSTSDLFLDILQAERHRRRGRFDAAVAQAGFGDRCASKNISRCPNQAAIAACIGVSLRVLNAWLNVDEDRPNALTLADRQSLAQFTCGDKRNEPWLSDGTCFDDSGELIAPDWAVSRTTIRELEMAAQATATVHASKLAYKAWTFSRIVHVVPTNFAWEIEKNPDALDSSSPLDAWHQAIQESGATGLCDSAVLDRILSTLDRARYSVVALWRRFPELTISAWNAAVANSWLDPTRTQRKARPVKAKSGSPAKPRSRGRSRLR